MPMLKITTGYGEDPKANPVVEVDRWAEYLRGPDGYCALCHGDPCNEHSSSNSDIASFYEIAPSAETCPVCEGRAA